MYKSVVSDDKLHEECGVFGIYSLAGDDVAEVRIKEGFRFIGTAVYTVMQGFSGIRSNTRCRIANPRHSQLP